MIAQWWTRWPGADPAWAVPHEFVVVDLDMKDGRNGLRDFLDLERLAADDIETPQALSPTGGRHLIYDANGVRFKNSAGLKHGSGGIDTRTAGGFIVLPAGQNGREWIKPLSVPVAPAPTWLKALAEAEPERAVAKTAAVAAAVSQAARAYSRAAFEGEVAEVRGATQGTRNETLNKAALKLGHHVAAGSLDEGDVRAALEAAADANGLTKDTKGGGLRGVLRTIESGLRAGMRDPARLPDDPRADADEYAEAVLAAKGAGQKGGPQPLADEAEPAAPYPIDALGDLLAPAARAIAEKIQCPPAMAGQSVLTVASLAAQALADVRLPHGQLRPLSLFALTIAASGDRKSSADAEAMIPVRMREAQLRQEYEPKKASFEIDRAAWRGQRAQIDRSKADIELRKHDLEALGPEPEQPIWPVLTLSETTHEGLTKNMPHLPGALGVFSAEGGQFLAGHGFTPEKKLATVASFSVLWDGADFRRLRAGDGLTDLRGRRVASHLMIQPDAAANVVSDPALRDQGFLARFLLAAPTTLAGERLWKEPASELEPTLSRYAGRMCSIFEAEICATNSAGNELNPRVLELSDEARAVWIYFHDAIEREQKRGKRYANLRDFAGKAPEQAARIAGILSIVEDRDANEIDGDAMFRGCEIAEWHLNETLRLITATLKRARGCGRQIAFGMACRKRPFDVQYNRNLQKWAEPYSQRRTAWTGNQAFDREGMACSGRCIEEIISRRRRKTAANRSTAAAPMLREPLCFSIS